MGLTGFGAGLAGLGAGLMGAGFGAGITNGFGTGFTGATGDVASVNVVLSREENVPPFFKTVPPSLRV